MFISDDVGESVEIGTLKIARLDMQEATPQREVATPIERTFTRLSNDYVSVGQDSSYYENLVELLGSVEARSVLSALQDLAVGPDRIDEVVASPVVSDSLFRYVGTSTIREQFGRIVQGRQTHVEHFSVDYQYLGADDMRLDSVQFQVDRLSSPPTNIHVLIGSNGTGKTRALRDMRAFFDPESSNDPPRSYLKMSDSTEIAGVVAVSFSAFDQGQPPSIGAAKNLKYTVADVRYDSATRLGEQFREAVLGCLEGGPDRRSRLQTALRFLESDQVLAEARLSEVDSVLNRLDFDKLSSGHKIVLLTIANLVRLVDEKCLVLLDEPETHLHPPLLSALIRSVSWLLADRNGLAIIATHSPVVLQEVPKGCAWKVMRSGDQSRISAVSDETFGENVGVLTQDVFRLELRRSGYYQLLEEAAAASATYDDAISRLGGSIGEEASLLLRGMFSERR